MANKIDINVFSFLINIGYNSFSLDSTIKKNLVPNRNDYGRNFPLAFFPKILLER